MRTGWVLLWILFGVSPASALEFPPLIEFPALFDVVHVDASDTLNVRSGPGTAYDSIGDIPHDETGIQVVRTDDTGMWGLIAWEYESGWISMIYVEQREPQYVEDSHIEGGISCGGSEPGWHFEINSDRSVDFWSMSRISEGEFVEDQGELRWSVKGGEGWRGGPVIFKARTEALTLTGFLVRKQCDFTVSDLPSGLQLSLVLENATERTSLIGCCTLRALD